ncbi:hypothetical protein TNIN_53591 [Trichonephila inaurata madagascariensis]|uniref:Uncharacterized protein n=1 Tax=Trichonephila inaurata madagascariensis TaxID=2747483 RepID=A0A8X6YMF4_9ARAC|nr:hypothetical protein TNIN_53591 [Trichonephila inaurata madagascariensis]
MVPLKPRKSAPLRDKSDKEMIAYNMHPQNYKSVRVRSGICGSHRNGKWHKMMRSPKYCSRTLQTDFAIRERTPPNDVLRTFCISNSGVT